MIPHHSTSKLERAQASSTYTSEASMLSVGGRYPLFGRVYADSCDEGCILVSSRTGCELRMVVKMTHRNVDNDITHWELESDPTDTKRCKLDAPLKLTVFNT